jgi:site-specific recombinase XerD
MRLPDLVVTYLDYRRALGARMKGEAFILRAFCKTVADASPSAITVEQVRAYLYRGCVTPQTIARKLRALNGFYRYLATRHGIQLSALPRAPKTKTSTFVPYIYSHEEIRRLLQAAPIACKNPLALFDEHTLRTVLLLLYGAGLRLGEAIRLDVGDVDLDEGVLIVRRTKFFKTRLVPLGKDLARVLNDYRQRYDRLPRSSVDRSFFRMRNGERVEQFTVERTFRLLRKIAQVHRPGGARRQPRLHDLRHAAAVHRLIAWYRRGADLQYLLPRLATYLGHKDLSGTQHYLTLTPPLLQEASKRFERYAGGCHHG